MNLGDKIFKGLAWSMVERISTQSIQFILGVVLARILTPKEYGTYGILIVFIAISQVFIDSGFTKALIQKKYRTETDFSTVFYFNILISIVCYLILFLTAPLISNFYDLPQLDSLLKVLALLLILNAINEIPITILTIELDLKSITKINLSSTVLSGVIAIYMAYNGYGVWALVYQAIIRSTLSAILLRIFIKWKPKWEFSKKSLRQLFTFGSSLLISNLLGSITSNLNSILIGKYIGARDLGFYTRGVQFADIISTMFNSALRGVLLPGLSPVQDQRDVLISHTRTILRSSALFTVPIFIGLIVLAEPIILVLLTKKWLMAVPIMQIFCLARLITIISVININLLYVTGRSDLALRQQYLNIFIRVILLVISIKYGIIYIAIAELLSTSIHFFINTYFPGKMMKYGAFKQIKDLSPILLCVAIMLAIIIPVMALLNNDILKLIFIPILGFFVYWASIYFLRVGEYFLFIKKIKILVHKKK